MVAMAELAHAPKRSTREYLASWLGMLRADAKPLMVAGEQGFRRRRNVPPATRTLP